MSASLSVIGTGDFGRALGLRLLQHGFSVCYGSRYPQQRHPADINPALRDVTMATIPEAIDKSDVILLCVHSSAHASLQQFRESFRGKTVVDVSNVEDGKQDKNQSNAEKIATILPEAFVVKAFNTQSAYKLENGTSGEGNTVYVASDNADARNRVLQIARTCGFIGLDYGRLQSARKLEAMPLDLCGDWLVPVVITIVTTSLWLLFLFLHHYILRERPKSWGKFPAKMVNKIYGVESITLLALCYIPGSLAAILQIINGSKYKRFPAWLDYWLKGRKQLGLMALLLAAMHCVLSMGLLNSAYYRPLYLTSSVIVPANSTEDVRVKQDSLMNWQGETVVSLGVLALALLAILGITSIPAVGNLLNWRQWVFIQSYMGIFALFVAEAHVMARGTPHWSRKSLGELATSLSFMCSILPYIAILLKLIILIPCINNYVMKIRKGWERAPVKIDTTRLKQNSVDIEKGTHSNGSVGNYAGHTNTTVSTEL